MNKHYTELDQKQLFIQVQGTRKSWLNIQFGTGSEIIIDSSSRDK